MINYIISQNNLKIFDSWQISKRDFRNTLEQIKKENLDSSVWNRSFCSMIKEWAFHNFIYRLHIKREHTKDVDINYPLEWYEKIFYTLFGWIAWLFIK